MKGLLPLLLNFMALSSAFPSDRKDTNDRLDQLAQVGCQCVLLTADNKMFHVWLLSGPSKIVSSCRVLEGLRRMWSLPYIYL